MKIKGIKKAVGEYKRYNKGGYYSPEYGIMMYNASTGDVWTDHYYSIGHNSYRIYDDHAIINISKEMEARRITVSMTNVKEFIESYEEI